LVDRAHRKPDYEAIGRRLSGVFPVCTGLVVAGLPLSELTVQVDAEAIISEPIPLAACNAASMPSSATSAWVEGSPNAATEPSGSSELRALRKTQLPQRTAPAGCLRVWLSGRNGATSSGSSLSCGMPAFLQG
jgi:hypothetical protein